MAIICDRFDQLGFSNPSKACRLGILGGTFDPIHFGHLASAEQVREAFDLDAVVFVPTAQPVFKREQHITPAAQRYEMCLLATRSNPHFDVSSLEIDRGGDTYTVDTLRQLRAYYPSNVELFFIAGADAIATVSQWKDHECFGELAHFVGVTRPGFSMSSVKQRYDAHHCCSEKQQSSIAGSNVSVSYLEITALAISSSDLRARVKQGKSIRYLAPEEVVNYINAQQLYC